MTRNTVESMIIALEDIPEEGMDLSLDRDVSFASIEVSGPLQGSLFLQKAGNVLLVKGAVKALLACTCNLCLEDFGLPVSLDMDTACVPVKDMETQDKKELSPDALDESFYEDDRIDIITLIEEQILLTIPMKAVCRDECKGLCPSCGTNLNMSACGCVKKAVDPRFQKLKDIHL